MCFSSAFSQFLEVKWLHFSASYQLKVDPDSSICFGNAHMVHTPATVHTLETTWLTFENRLYTLYCMAHGGIVAHADVN